MQVATYFSLAMIDAQKTEYSTKEGKQGKILYENLNHTNIVYCTGMGPCFHVFAKDKENNDIFLCHADNTTDFILELKNFVDKKENIFISIGRIVEDKNRPSIYDDKDHENHQYFNYLLKNFGIKIEDNIYSFVATKNHESIERSSFYIEENDLLRKDSKLKFIKLESIQELYEILRRKDLSPAEKILKIAKLTNHAI